MPGVYLHIPFCKQACSYCDFHFSTSRKNQPDVIAAMLKELELRKAELSSGPISSIYFGGGTPSLLEKEELKSILTFLKTDFDLAPNIEVTLEANAESLQDEHLLMWREAGINRLSIGVQSFQEDVLSWMRRTHGPLDAVRGIPRAKHHGFDNISIDLIYGLPTHLNSAWEDGIQQAIDLEVGHISSYMLTTEPRTLLDAQVRKGEVILPSDEEVEEQYFTLVRHCESAGYDHYEVSNFGKPGFHSKHNTSYWNGIPYVGIGPSAHSFDGSKRSWNVRSNAGYVQEIGKGNLPSEFEQLSTTDRYNEYVMTKLRTRNGIELEYVRTTFDVDLKAAFSSYWAGLVANGKAREENGSWFLTDHGLIQADAIAAELFLIQE